MIIYNKTWLNNLQIQQEAEQLHNAGCLTHDELKPIKEAYPVGFYMPGPFARTGLFLLTCVGTSFSFSFLSLMMSSSGIIDSFGWFLFLGLICTIALEVLVKSKHYYRAGINDALMWIAFGLLTVATGWMLGVDNYGTGHTHYLPTSMIILVISFYFTLRYANTIMSIISCLLLFAVVFFTWQQVGSFGNATMPFIIMIVAALLYFQATKLIKKAKQRYYEECLIMVQIVSLVILYLAGNYFVIGYLNNMLNNVVTDGPPTGIKLGPFFWAWTMLLPLLYIIRGVMKKNIMLIRIGLVLFAVAIFTFRTYYHVMSTELAMIIGGIALLVIAYTITRYLKTPKHRFTHIDIDNTAGSDNLKLEALFTAATLGHSKAAPTQTDRFGGGNFGGGGTGGGF
ncbi:MAG: hypothetical protein V4560_13580 [Bacteroidota bacterium]